MNSHIHGFTLLEISLVIFLGILAITGFISAYLAIKINHNRQQLMGAMMDSQQFVENLLNQRIRTAGFVGCQSQQALDQEQAIIGYSSGHLPVEWKNQVVSGTDMFIMNSCVSQTHLSQESKIVKMAYFIGDTYRVNGQGFPILGLFEKAEGSDRLELAPGVEQMQILYSVRNNSDPELHYLSAMEVSNWQTVRDLQINLLINSIEPMLSHPKDYYFNGQTINSSDLLDHQAFNLYVHLRER
jgi:type IV pilus assembly protein PilW